MNIKRALLFGVLFWVFVFVIISIIMFIPTLSGRQLTQSIIFWVVNIPLVLLLAKWYFKKVSPTIKNGVTLGVITLLVATILDLIITVPLFVKSYSAFYSNWTLYIGYAEVIILCALAGGEFDSVKVATPDNQQNF